MRVLVAIDSFKGSLTSLEAGNSVKAGILKVSPSTEVKVFSLADGGEGTLDAIMSIKNGTEQTIMVHDALNRPIKAEYGLFSSTVAVIEIAKIVGLPLLTLEERNPLIASTYGIGEMILDALKKGAKRFYIGLGGSSTNDGGFNMLRALGYRFFDKNDEEITSLEKLLSLERIDDQMVSASLVNIEFILLSDVNNPLLGPMGCSYVFGKQKGATITMEKHLEDILTRFSYVVNQQYHTHFHLSEGAGAAGGLGFAFLAFLNAKLVSGSEWLLNEINLEKEIKNADYVITGEGKIDWQSLMGKGPGAVANLAKKYHKKVIAFTGIVDKTIFQQKMSFDEIYEIIDHPATPHDLKKEVAEAHLKRKTEEVFRTFLK